MSAGYANQYVDNPIMVKVGEPIRIFLVNAGPNAYSTFHVVGAIFDRVCVNANPRNELFGLQSWVALPIEDEEVEPSFTHYGVAELPVIEYSGVTLTLIAGSLFGKSSPVKTFSEMFYADVSLETGASLQIDAEFEERGIYIVSGAVSFESEPDSCGAGQLLVLKPSEKIVITAADGPARIMLLGGEPIGPRNIWWNFVSSSVERIEQAKLDWKEHRIGEIPGENERIPLPADSRPRVVDYP